MDYSFLQIDSSASILSALEEMEKIQHKLLLVFSGDVFVGIISIGDVQRAVIKNIPLTESISKIMRVNYTYCSTSDNKDDVYKKMLKGRIECMPILDKNGALADVVLWSDLFSEESPVSSSSIRLPVVIMAGGKGTRLKPLTNIYPKPLIPIGEKTVIETIMDKFLSYDCHDFYISVNYKAGMIKNYFSYLNNNAYHISYFQEEKPMGTAGSLRLLKDSIHSTFFVSNCDTIINEDYANILEYHRNNHNELTVVAALKTYSIPYGTIRTGLDGILEGVDEKPTLTFKVNTGLYILEPTVFDDIPDDFFHITHLMDKLRGEGRRVGIYPISQNDWTDMGDWDEYLSTIRKYMNA